VGANKVIWVAMECNCHDLALFLGMFGSGTVSHPSDAGEGPHLLPNHTVYIQLWNKEVLQHVTSNGSVNKKEWFVNLSSVNSTENIHLQIVSHMFDNLVQIL
jgi:hypothetical protein